MNSHARVQRIHHLYRQLQALREREQQALARRLDDERDALAGLREQAAAAERAGWDDGAVATAGDAALWGAYMGMLRARADAQSEVVAACGQRLEEGRRETLLAMREAKGWETLDELTWQRIAERLQKAEQAAADELALTRRREPAAE